MFSIHRKPRWAIPESEVTPEAVWLDRRQLIGGVTAMAALAPLPLGAAESDPSAGLYPAPRNERYTVEGDITPEEINSRFNNFYEFGSHKNIASAAQALPTRPWEIAIDGLVEKPATWAIDDLLRQVSLEERIYRIRCVEAWSMTIPYTGFPLSRLVELARPLSSARYLRFETFHNPAVASGQKQVWYPWPYVEGVTMAEAANELAFLVTGAYGKPAAKQFGAPIRLSLPWKYGFKSIKSIVRISFTEERPRTFWQEIAPHEYGFWANVNPDVPHPRWSQATEQILHTRETVETRLFNGYGEMVAHLYSGLDDEPLYM
jgi:sulfoxide reductase catalytic subunit YedY